MHTADRVFGWLMVVSAALHCVGTFAAHLSAETTLWALAAGLGELLLAALNLLRAGRPADRTLASVTLAGNLGWLIVVLAFGRLVGNYADYRVLIQGAVTLVLLGMSMRTLRARPGSSTVLASA